MTVMCGANPAPKVFIVDDDLSILGALRRLLESVGLAVETYSSPRQFLAAHDPEAPGCALIDIGMEELDGLTVQKALLAAAIPRPVIFVTGCDDVQVSVQAMKSGAMDFLSKPFSDTELLAAVQNALDADFRSRQDYCERAEFRRHYDLLTPREREVMALVLCGRLNKQIAFELGIVEKTAKVHRSRVMEKMQVRSVAALAHMADRLGLF